MISSFFQLYVFDTIHFTAIPVKIISFGVRTLNIGGVFIVLVVMISPHGTASSQRSSDRISVGDAKAIIIEVH